MKRRTLSIILISFIVTLSFGVHIFAASPSKALGFQGQLFSSNAPVTASVNATFTFYDALSGGAVTGSPIAKTITVANGYFGTQFTESDTTGVNFDQALYVQVNINGTDLSPRTALNAAPTALKSFGTFSYASAPAVGPAGSLYFNSVSNTLFVSNGTSWTATASSTSSWLMNGSDTYFNAGNVGIGTSTSPIARLTISGTTGSTTDLLAITSPTGLSRYFTVGSNGKVAIGTTTVAGTNSQLAITGALSVDSNGVGDGIDNGIWFGALGGSFTGESIASKRTAGIGQNGLNFNTQYATRLTILNGGNVGVGTTSPNAKFTVAASGANGFNLDADTANAALSSRFYLSNGTSGSSTAMFNNSGDFVFLTNGLLGTTSGTERMRITNAGNIGIGTTTPIAKLSVTGTTGTSDLFIVASSTNAVAFNINSSGGVGLGTRNTGTDLFTIVNPGPGNRYTTIKDSETNSGTLRLGAVYGVPGIATVETNKNLSLSSGPGFSSIVMRVGKDASNIDIAGAFYADGLGQGLALGNGTSYAGGNGILYPELKGTDIVGGLNQSGYGLVIRGGSGSGQGVGGDLVFKTTPASAVSNTSTNLPVERLRILASNGFVGIGTSTPSANLTASGTIRFINLGSVGANLITDSLGNVTVSSDERLKDIKGMFESGLDKIKLLSPILYTWKPETGYDTANTYAGFSAQNVQSAIPEAVSSDSRGYLTLADRPILATLVNAVKELSVKVEKIATWFADDKFKVQNDVCVDDVCVTKDQFKNMLLQSKNGGSMNINIHTIPSQPVPAVQPPAQSGTTTSPEPVNNDTIESIESVTPVPEVVPTTQE
ncbi:MAG: tail fiber domain-containing protein [Patescibacteria group bacterium]